MTRPAVLAAGICALTLGSGCRPETPDPGNAATDVMAVAATELSFEAPDTVSAGWVTIRFDNRSPVTHFALVERLPDTVDGAMYRSQVASLFQRGMNLLASGQSDSAMVIFGQFPDWFARIVYMGGPGLTAPGHQSETTVHLDPGTYLLECYVKSGGTFHSYNGDSTARSMLHQFEVVAPASQAREPVADFSVAISSDSGIRMPRQPTAGRHTLAVKFIDQRPYENFVGHSVHLVRLDDSTHIDSLSAWMDWSSPGGLEVPAPATFLGGINAMPPGGTGYISVDLRPGRYAWVAAIPNPDRKGMLVPFSVE